MRGCLSAAAVTKVSLRRVEQWARNGRGCIVFLNKSSSGFPIRDIPKSPQQHEKIVISGILLVFEASDKECPSMESGAHRLVARERSGSQAD